MEHHLPCISRAYFAYYVSASVRFIVREVLWCYMQSLKKLKYYLIGMRKIKYFFSPLKHFFDIERTVTTVMVMLKALLIKVKNLEHKVDTTSILPGCHNCGDYAGGIFVVRKPDGWAVGIVYMKGCPH